MKRIIFCLFSLLLLGSTTGAQAATMAYLGTYVASDIDVVAQVDKALVAIGRTLKEGEPIKVCLTENRILDIHYSEINYEVVEKCEKSGWLYGATAIDGADKGEYLIAHQVGEGKKYDFYLFEAPVVSAEDTVLAENKEPTTSEVSTTAPTNSTSSPQAEDLVASPIETKSDRAVIDQPAPPTSSSAEQIVALPRDMRAGEKTYKTLSFLKTISPMEQMITFAHSIGLLVERSVQYNVCIDNSGSEKIAGTDLRFLFDVRSCLAGEKGKTPGTFGKYYTDAGRLAGVTMLYPNAKNPQSFSFYGVVYIPDAKTPVKTAENAPQTAEPKELPKEAVAVAITPVEAEPAKVEKPKPEEKPADEPQSAEKAEEGSLAKAKKTVCEDDLWASLDPNLLRETDEEIYGFLQDWALVSVVMDAKGYRPLASLLPGKNLDYRPSCIFSAEQVAKAQARLSARKVDLDKVEVGVCYEHTLTITDTATSAVREEEITDCGRIDAVVYSNGRALLSVLIGRRHHADGVGICEVKKFKSRLADAQETFEKLQRLECAKPKSGASS